MYTTARPTFAGTKNFVAARQWPGHEGLINDVDGDLVQIGPVNFMSNAWSPSGGNLRKFEKMPELSTHSPAVTNDGGMMAILREDQELFKTLNSRCENMKKAVVALSGKKKKGTEIETDDEDD